MSWCSTVQASLVMYCIVIYGKAQAENTVLQLQAGSSDLVLLEVGPAYMVTGVGVGQRDRTRYGRERPEDTGRGECGRQREDSARDIKSDSA